MRTLRLSLVGTVMLVLLGWSSTVVVAQAGSSTTGAAIETVWELPIPADALPEDFVKFVVEEWTLAPSTDTTGDRTSVLGNEALRGRGLVVESGEFVITPATEALLWQGSVGGPETVPAGAAVTLAAGDAIFLPAMPDDAVETDAPIGIANPGTEEATALAFHTHQAGGEFYGYPPGLTLGDWNMDVGFDPEAVTAFDGVDILLRLSRMTGETGATLPVAEAPAVSLYLVEEGTLEQLTSGPGGEFSSTWPAGQNGFLPRAVEGVEQSLTVAGDGPASVLELAAIPQPPDA